MYITFPYMGSVIVYKKILEQLGHQVLVPPRPSKKTFDLGVKHSPEFACFPFKAIMGSYIEACEMGAEVIVTSGGHGPCRAGFYSEIHQRELQKLGYDVDVIVLDSFFRGKKKFLSQLERLRGNNSWLKVLKAIKFTYRLIKMIDQMDKEIRRIRPYEINQGETEKVWEEILKHFEQVRNDKELEVASKKAKELINSIELYDIRESNRLRIGIVGEIYVVMEPSVNMEIERLLGELGCETERSHYLSDWVDHNMLPKFKKGYHEEEIIKKGERFIEIDIGGHAKETIGNIIDFKERGFDGIVHLMPFGCLPELISQSVIPKLSKQYNIPIMTLSLDEQTGQANNRTRIEAFVELLKNKKMNSYSA